MCVGSDVVQFAADDGPPPAAEAAEKVDLAVDVACLKQEDHWLITFDKYLSHNLASKTGS